MIADFACGNIKSDLDNGEKPSSIDEIIENKNYFHLSGKLSIVDAEFQKAQELATRTSDFAGGNICAAWA